MFNSLQIVLADTVTIASDLWCPYNCDPKDAKPGYAVEIAKIAFERAGHKFSYSVEPWNRAVASAKENKISGVIGATKMEVTDFIFGKEYFAISQSCFFVRANDPWVYKNNSSLDKRLIGTVKDYVYPEALNVYFKAHEKNLVPSFGDHPMELNLNKLAAKRLDTIIENSDVITNYINSNKLQGKFKNVGCVGGDELYIAFGPKNPKAHEYAKILDQATLELKKSGEYSKILAKYGLK